MYVLGVGACGDGVMFMGDMAGGGAGKRRRRERGGGTERGRIGSRKRTTAHEDGCKESESLTAAAGLEWHRRRMKRRHQEKMGRKWRHHIVIVYLMVPAPDADSAVDALSFLIRLFYSPYVP